MKISCIGMLATMGMFLGGCAHSQLRSVLNLGPFESTNAKHLQINADTAFPKGMPYAEVRNKLAMSSGEVPPVEMFFTLRPWPFDPWEVSADDRELHAVSEDGRNWLLWWMRSFVYLDFTFDREKRLETVTVMRNDMAI